MWGGMEAKWHFWLSPSLFPCLSDHIYTHAFLITHLHPWQVAQHLQMCILVRIFLLKRSEAYWARSETYQYSKGASLNRWGWQKKESKSSNELRHRRANKKHLVGRYLTATEGRFPGDSVSSFTPNSFSNVCSNGSVIVFKVTPLPRIRFPFFFFLA